MKRIATVLVACAMLAGALVWSIAHFTRGGRTTTASPSIRIETRHFEITSTASREKTQLVAARVESLHDAYVAFFGDLIGRDRDKAGLQLVLFRDRAEFKAHNDSAPWAEAFYRAPACRAYFQEGAANPYHWMLHEEVHQLNNEVAHFKLRRWVNEGLATYFGTSAIEDGKLVPGEVDPNTYPIWWLHDSGLTGDLKVDIASRRIIPLRTLIGETQELTVADDVNLHYIEYWSLTHFLIHFDHGKYAAGYRRLVAGDGSLADFEAKIGPVETIEREWYAYLRGEIADLTVTPIR